MRKPRKGPGEKKKQRKKLTKWNIMLPVLLVGGGTGLAMGFNYFFIGPPPVTQCIESENMPFQLYVQLDVTLDGELFGVPANIGITDECVRPVHTHDADGTLHIAYIKPTAFSLGDLIRIWGLDLRQYGATVLVNSGDGNFMEYRESLDRLFFQDKMEIRIELATR